MTNFGAKYVIQYIDYERLKDVLYEFKENAPAEDSVEKSEIERYFQQSSESFFQEIEKELQKVNLFFGEKLNEAARRFTQLKVCNSKIWPKIDKKNPQKQPKSSPDFSRTMSNSIKKQRKGQNQKPKLQRQTFQIIKMVFDVEYQRTVQYRQRKFCELEKRIRTI